jgi:hypothetical protein|tara:strand:- start:295 stop:591 length:297 start_codon:yes stop_codon:yes gene_type:complete
MFVKSKSICFQKLIENIDTVLARIYSETTTGEPLGYNSDEWCNARDRLMSIKVGSEHNHTYPVNFQLADHFILSELASRVPACREHVEEYKLKMSLRN